MRHAISRPYSFGTLMQFYDAIRQETSSFFEIEKQRVNERDIPITLSMTFPLSVESAMS